MMKRFHHNEESKIPIVPIPIREVLVSDGDFSLVPAPDKLIGGDFRDYSIANLQKAGIPLERVNSQIDGDNFSNIENALEQLKNVKLNESEN